MEQQRYWAMSGYLIFILPLFFGQGNLCRFHANQGFDLLVSYLVASGILRWLPFVGEAILVPAAGIVWFCGVIYGMINAYRGKYTPLPLIGRWQIL